MAHRIHAFTDDALGRYDAVGLVDALHTGQVSMARCSRRPSAGRAGRAGAERDRLPRLRPGPRRGAAPASGLLRRVPTWVKDNVDVAGLPTLEGTDAWDAQPATVDGDFARMFLATGAVPLGKTRLSEYGFLPTCEHPRLGPVRCPWTPDDTAGASSAGSAALVAAGVVPIAHANDGGGSIRIPAAVNGLVGLKPTRDRHPTDKLANEQPVQIVADGVVTRSVRDTAAFMREAEQDLPPPAPAAARGPHPPDRRRGCGSPCRPEPWAGRPRPRSPS